MTLQQIILFALKASVALSVVALGLKATMADATHLLRRTSLLFRALLSMNIVMPIAALILALTFNLHPAVKIALVALSVSPVPPIFPKKAMKAGGPEDYCVGLLVAASLLAIVVVPLAMEIFGRIAHLHLQMPVRAVVSLVFATVLAPLLFGMILRAMMPALADKISKPLAQFASITLLVCVLPILVASSRTIISLIGNRTVLAFIVFTLVGLASGHLLGGPDTDNRHVLSLATSTRHPGIAAAIAHTNFPNQKLAVPAVLLYVIIAAIVSALVSAAQAKSNGATSSERRAA
jgi:bile acid:Na+ symporter, BASS family